MQAILDLALKDLESYLKKQNFPHFAAQQIFTWIYKKEIFDFDRMTNLSKDLRNFLKRNFYILGLALIKKQVSFDGIQKFLFALSDKQGVESVIIPNIASLRGSTPRHQRNSSGKDTTGISVSRRFTGCISTQAGCRFDCRFCASGAQGWRRNLKTGEIIEQAIYLRNIVARRIDNLVFMGMGEPLDNYDNVLKVIHILNSSYSFNIGARKMTISTCGLIPGIQRLVKENLQIELSISLHAADNPTRTFLMPINKRYPLEELLKTCRNYFKKTKRQITFEYVLIKGINSDLKQARKLTKLLTHLDAKVNLIAVSAFKDEFSPPNKLEILLFRDTLLKAGIPTTIRRSRGADIQAACGQLRLRSNDPALLARAKIRV